MKSAREVMEELDDRLRKTDQSYLTLPWKEFYTLCGRERIKRPFEDSIQQEASGRSLIVGYGQNVVVVCPDRNVAPAPHWVATRAACQVEGVYEDILKAVQEDVAAMNKLPAQERMNLQYKYERRLPGQAGVFVAGEYGPLATDYNHTVPMSVIFTKEGNGRCIQIQRKITRPGENADVTPRWNAEEQSCELIWDDDTNHPLEAQQVSQKALEPLFFDNKENTGERS